MRVRNDRNDMTTIFKSHSINKYNHIIKCLENDLYVGKSLDETSPMNIRIISCQFQRKAVRRYRYRYVGTFYREYILYGFNVLVNNEVPEFSHVNMLIDSYMKFPKPFFRIYMKTIKNDDEDYNMKLTNDNKDRMWLPPDLEVAYNNFLFDEGKY